VDITRAEQQIIYTIRYLSRKNPPTRDKVVELRELILGKNLVEWGESMDDLLKRGIVHENDKRLTLSDSIKEEAERLYLEWSEDGFSEALIKSEESAAYSEYCKRLYGADLCQFNMMDMEQLGHLLEVLSLSSESRVLELGCGIGTITDYISDTTGATITGIDFAAKAIGRAQERTVTKQDKLTFIVQNMDSLDFPTQTFDTIIAIDTLYFVSNLEETVGRCKKLLKPDGQMGLLYSQILRSEESDDLLQPNNTNLACQLREHSLSYEFWDYSENDREFWQQSRKIAEDMRSEFEAEGNLDLYESRIKESEQILKSVNEGRTSRYLYHVRK